MDCESATLEALDVFTLTAQVYPETCDQSVTWTSSDPTVATVDANGVVTAVGRGATGSGTATITATASARAENGSELTAQCYITVRSDGERVDNVQQLTSEHPYRDGENRFWEFSISEASSLALTFAPETALGTGDFLVLEFGDNEQNSYKSDNISELAGQTIAIPGNAFRIWLISDSDENTGWGFQVTNVVEATEEDQLVQAQSFADPLKDINTPMQTGGALNAANPGAAAGASLGAPADAGTTTGGTPGTPGDTGTTTGTYRNRRDSWRTWGHSRRSRCVSWRRGRCIVNTGTDCRYHAGSEPV